MPRIKDIRDYALTRKPGSAFAAVMAVEKDEISESDFSAKIPVWFALLALEEKGV